MTSLRVFILAGISAGILAVVVAYVVATAPSGTDLYFMPGPLGRERVMLPRPTATLRASDYAPLDASLGRDGQPARPILRPPGDGANLGERGTARPSLGFLTRSIGLREGAEQAWGRRNGVTDSLWFSHHLGGVFPPSLYATHPEFFPLVDGKRLQPPANAQFWQPDLGREDIARFAADQAKAYFARNPAAPTYSLGINDGLLFGESPETLALTQPQRWFRGRPDFSRLVFTFMNRAAANLAQSFPDKYLGCLAYYWCENAPPFTVDRHVIPFLTADRSQSYDPAFRKEELNLQTRWAAAMGGSALKQRGNAQRLTLNAERLSVPMGSAVAHASISAFRHVGRSDSDAFTGGNGANRGFQSSSAAQGVSKKEVGTRGPPVLTNDPANASPSAKASSSAGTSSSAGPTEDMTEDGQRLTRSTNSGQALNAERSSGAENVSGAQESASRIPYPASRIPYPVSRVPNPESRIPNITATIPAARLGLYDYLDGAGFLIPRVPIHAFAEHIRHAHAVGFTDYYGESSRNWGLDGPMPWVIAQLLQNPEQNVDALLDEYYQAYFQSAALPMRRFFDRCEQQWMHQPGPSYWLKHYRNESQAVVFPSSVCAELRQLLNDAAARANNRRVRERVTFVADAFGVTERFVAMYEARARVTSDLLRHELSGEPGAKELIDYLEKRTEFIRYTDQLTHASPLAFYPIPYADFLRNDPSFAAALALLRSSDDSSVGGVSSPRSVPPSAVGGVPSPRSAHEQVGTGGPARPRSSDSDAQAARPYPRGDPRVPQNQNSISACRDVGMSAFQEPRAAPRIPNHESRITGDERAPRVIPYPASRIPYPVSRIPHHESRITDTAAAPAVAPTTNYKRPTTPPQSASAPLNIPRSETPDPGPPTSPPPPFSPLPPVKPNLEKILTAAIRELRAKLSDVGELPFRDTATNAVEDGIKAAAAQRAAAAYELLESGSFEGPIVPNHLIAGLPYRIDLPPPWQSRVEPTEAHRAALRPVDQSTRLPVEQRSEASQESAEVGTGGSPVRTNDPANASAPAPTPTPKYKIPITPLQKSAARALQISGAENTYFYQWAPALPGHLYVASGWTRARISSSDTVMLVLGWLDEHQQRIGDASSFRLPDGDWSDWVQLQQAARAPAHAAWVGVSVIVQHQAPGDFAEFTALSLRAAD